ncbi:hypothetical protein C8R46DRAFT_1301707 [Mycena filopes]|nr:hypothetical protein C8R46DRAFT_1301707 [Mycena filopes]
MHAVVDMIPLLLHVSLVLFLAGLVAFLVPINHLMMGLISAILAIFLGLYATLTLLPIISLDSPYHTPFSTVAWNIMRYLRSRRGWGPLPPPVPNLKSNMDDTVLACALTEPEARDRKALLWTMHSLTDDTEFLPFLEAIPEAIHGINGFHLVNDHLFIPLLNTSSGQPSIGDRIRDLILSCRNLATDDPRRERNMTAALKAIWALGMISGRTGELFDHREGHWFYIGEYMRPEYTSDPTDTKLSLRKAADVAIVHTVINHARNRLVSVVEAVKKDIDRASLVVALTALTSAFHELDRKAEWTHQRSHFSPLVKTLQGWCSAPTPQDSRAELKALLVPLLEDNIWKVMRVLTLCTFIMTAGWINSIGRDLPYEFGQTCFRILPSYVDIPLPDGVSRIVATLPNSILERAKWVLDPSQFKVSPTKMKNLDHIMAHFFRLFPYLTPNSGAITISTVYLAKRGQHNDVYIALRFCDVEYLQNCLTKALTPTQSDNRNILHAIGVLLAFTYIVPNGPMRLGLWTGWHARDNIVYDFMLANGVLDDPEFSLLSAIMRVRKLRQLSVRAPTLLHLEVKPDSPEAVQSAHDKWRTFVAEPLLLCPRDISLAPDIGANEIVADVRTRVRRATAIHLTDFLLACVDNPEEAPSGETIDIICCYSCSLEGADSEVMLNLVAAGVGCLAKVPDLHVDALLNRNVQGWTKQIAAHPRAHYSPASVSRFKEVLAEYLEYSRGLEEPKSKPRGWVEIATRALEGMTALESTEEQSD